jgi:hypothetical protein
MNRLVLPLGIFLRNRLQPLQYTLDVVRMLAFRHSEQQLVDPLGIRCGNSRMRMGRIELATAPALLRHHRVHFLHNILRIFFCPEIEAALRQSHGKYRPI